jgi:hypothetical protein
LRALDDSERSALAEAVAGRARLGRQAAGELARARSLPVWRFAEARWLAFRAADAYEQLGNDLAAADARRLVEAVDRRQAPSGWALLVTGIALLLWNVHRRARDARLGGRLAT